MCGEVSKLKVKNRPCPITTQDKADLLKFGLLHITPNKYLSVYYDKCGNSGTVFNTNFPLQICQTIGNDGGSWTSTRLV